MCSEPIVLHLDIRVLGFTSTKVNLISFLYKPFDRIEYFVLVIFDGINLSTASTKPVLNLTHIALTDM